ncbi:hypothetical protein ANO11243_050360 [Dothideomycetidae sp. 11243]|nr:hypothetical protein ANO11243_050360 [fungal sp. No.11243]
MPGTRTHFGTSSPRSFTTDPLEILNNQQIVARPGNRMFLSKVLLLPALLSAGNAIGALTNSPGTTNTLQDGPAHLTKRAGGEPMDTYMQTHAPDFLPATISFDNYVTGRVDPVGRVIDGRLSSDTIHHVIDQVLQQPALYAVVDDKPANHATIVILKDAKSRTEAYASLDTLIRHVFPPSVRIQTANFDGPADPFVDTYHRRRQRGH